MIDQHLAAMIDVIHILDERVGHAIPKSTEKLREILLQNPAHYKIPKLLAKETITGRTTTWIEENGLCLDNIMPGRSTIKQAGRGAFAISFQRIINFTNAIKYYF